MIWLHDAVRLPRRRRSIAIVGASCSLSSAADWPRRARFEGMPAHKATAPHTRPRVGGCRQWGMSWPAGYFPAGAVLSPRATPCCPGHCPECPRESRPWTCSTPVDGHRIQKLELDPSASARAEGVAPGLVFSHDGRHVLLATANKDAIVELGWEATAQHLTIEKSFPLPAGSYPQTVAISPKTKIAYTPRANWPIPLCRSISPPAKPQAWRRVPTRTCRAEPGRADGVCVQPERERLCRFPSALTARR